MRWITIAALFIAWLVVNLIYAIRAVRNERRLPPGSPLPRRRPPRSDRDRGSAEEVALLSDRLARR